MEDVARRNAQVALYISRRIHLDTRVSFGIGHQAVRDRLGQHRIEGGVDGGEGIVSIEAVSGSAGLVSSVGGEERVRRVQAKQRQCVSPCGSKVLGQNARVAKAVAVDLRGQGSRQLSAGRRSVGRLELPIALVHMEGATEGIRWVD